MAIDYHDLTAVGDTLKNVYGVGLQNQFNDETTTYNQFPKSERSPRGNGYFFGIRYARTQSVGARSESQLLPDPLAGKYDQGKIVPKYVYGTLRVTGPMIEAAKTDTAAFVDQLSDTVDDVYQSLIVDLNRQCWGDGFGLIGTLSAASDAVTTSGTTTWTVTMDNDRGLIYAQPGMVVDFFQSTAIDQSSVASRISTLDVANKTMEMEPNDGTYKTNHPITAAQSYTIATDTVASGSFMVRSGAREATHAASNTSVEMLGMDAIFDDGTNLTSFENISESTYTQWKANILSNSSVNRELELDLMLQAVDLARMESGKRISTMRMGLGQRRKYANLLLPDVRFAPTKLEGGYEVLTFAAGDGSVKIVVDPVAQPNCIYCHPDGVIKKYEMSPLSWGGLDQGWHQRAQYDEFDHFLRIYTNLGVEQRNCLVKISDLTEPSLYS